MTSVEPVRADVPQPVDDDDDARAQWLWNRRSDMLYHVRLSAIYHLRRENYFDMADRWSSMLTALAATAAVGALLKGAQGIDLAVSIVTAFLSLLPLVFNPAEKARRHGQLAAEYRRLRADAERAGHYWTEEQCDHFASRALDIEVAEAPPLGALVIKCQNELAIALGRPSDTYPLRFYESWFAQLWNFDAGAICARRDGPRRQLA